MNYNHYHQGVQLHDVFSQTITFLHLLGTSILRLHGDEELISNRQEKSSLKLSQVEERII